MLRPAGSLPCASHSFSQGFVSPDFAGSRLLATRRLGPYLDRTFTGSLCLALLGARGTKFLYSRVRAKNRVDSGMDFRTKRSPLISRQLSLLRKSGKRQSSPC